MAEKSGSRAAALQIATSQCYVDLVGSSSAKAGRGIIICQRGVCLRGVCLNGLPKISGKETIWNRRNLRGRRGALLNENSVASGSENVNKQSAVTESPFEWGEAVSRESWVVSSKDREK